MSDVVVHDFKVVRALDALYSDFFGHISKKNPELLRDFWLNFMFKTSTTAPFTYKISIIKAVPEILFCNHDG